MKKYIYSHKGYYSKLIREQNHYIYMKQLETISNWHRNKPHIHSTWVYKKKTHEQIPEMG